MKKTIVVFALLSTLLMVSMATAVPTKNAEPITKIVEQQEQYEELIEEIMIVTQSFQSGKLNEDRGVEGCFSFLALSDIEYLASVIVLIFELIWMFGSPNTFALFMSPFFLLGFYWGFCSQFGSYFEMIFTGVFCGISFFLNWPGLVVGYIADIIYDNKQECWIEDFSLEGNV